ncbi:MAG TPA: sterol desaturase family protein [Pseudomonadota bacterium]|jgi:sterol desaturase/sphingolipid hydroxylase (fatty acid hydroxylase superfamily)|nr:sterol desaturase family protein [Pseudomonadota bacterium]
MGQWITQHPPQAIFLLFVVFAMLEALRGSLRSPQATREDLPLEASITFLFGAVLYPGIMLAVDFVARRHVPELAERLAHLPTWAMIGMLLIGDDLTQYLWHRASHTPLLWPLHRAHHSAPHMGVRVVYRNNFFYYALMPGLWISAFLVFLGLGPVYPAYVLIKMLVIFGAHSEIRWDQVLYRHRWLHPVAWIVERTISTSATHFAHHAITQDDGVGHYKGNYGNLLFLWDVLFGTARITRRYPPRVGLADDVAHGPERWWVQLFYPLLKSKRTNSALAREPTIVG